MTDQISNDTTGQVAPAPAQVTAPATTDTGTITKQDLEAFREEIKQSLAQLYQGVQSKTDKFQSKMQQKMEAFENAAKAAGVPLTDAEKQMYQTQAKLEILNQETSPAQKSFVYQPGQVVPQGLTEEEFTKGVEAAADAIFKANQVEIKRGDPEDAIIAAAEDKEPDDYLKAVQQAIDAKKARLGTSATAQPTSTPATSASPGLVRGTPISNPIQDLDRDELWKLAKKKLG